MFTARVFRLVVSVWMVLLVCATATVALFRRPALSTLPESLASRPGFDICALPCWANLIPGETRYGDSSRTISEALPQADLDFFPSLMQVDFKILQDGETTYGAIYEDRGRIGGLRLEANTPVWQLLDLLGEPACVQSNQVLQNSMRVLTLYWMLETSSITGILTVSETGHWRPDQPVSTLFILYDVDPCVTRLTLPWRGFARLWLYQQ
ncbi:MAG: hypothetical protein K8L99_11725 [Anaerolineae bacterium]|nr:hypothetical protein [Anaerolineae bacterium]